MARIGFLASRPEFARDRVALWLSLGCALERVDGVWRLKAPAGRTGGHAPSPAPIPDAIAREFIARGAAVARADDLFAEAA